MTPRGKGRLDARRLSAAIAQQIGDRSSRTLNVATTQDAGRHGHSGVAWSHSDTTLGPRRELLRQYVLPDVELRYRTAQQQAYSTFKLSSFTEEKSLGNTGTLVGGVSPSVLYS